MIKKILLLSLLTPALLFAHEEVFSVQGSYDDKFGASVTAASNPGQDPASLVFVSAPLADVAPFGANVGQVIVYRGSTGEVLAPLSSFDAGDGFGSTLRNIGDLDGDGFDEIGVYFNEDNGGDLQVGQFDMYTSKDLSRPEAEEGVLAFDKLGQSFTGISDTNGNGGRDYVMFDGYGASDFGRIAFYDGKTKLVIRYKIGTQADGAYGETLENIGDLNGDGVEDLIVGAYGESKIDPVSGDPDPDYLYSGRVHILSGADGSLIDLINGQESSLQLGQYAKTLGDINGDGVADFALRGERFTRAKYLYIYNGATRELLQELNGLDSDADFGQYVARLGDLTGDGIDEFAVSAQAKDSAGGRYRVHILRGGTFNVLDTISLTSPQYIAGLNSLDFNNDGKLDLAITGSDYTTNTVTIYDLDIPEPESFEVASKARKRGKLTINLTLTDNFETCDLEMNLAPSKKKLDRNKKTNIYSGQNLGLLDSLNFIARRLPSLTTRRKTLFLEVIFNCNDTENAREVVKLSFKKNRSRNSVKKGGLIRAIKRKIKLAE